MSDQVVPITGLNTVGLVKDTPAIALPPNAFSDVMNVRFNNGCVSKMSGEETLFSSFIGDTATFFGNMIHIAWWANPNLTPTNGYFLVVTTDNTHDYVYLIRASDGYIKDLGIKVTAGGDWQHTVYQGGYAIILNNGIARPMYILDADGNTDITVLDMFELPGWDSYYANEVVFNDTFDSAIHLPEFDLGRVVDFQIEQVIANVYDGNDNSLKFQIILDSETTVEQGTLSYDESTASHFLTIATAPGGDPLFTDFLESGDIVYITVRSLGTVQVRAGVIREWGDALVAGNLTEVNAPLVDSVNVTNSTITFVGNHSLSIGDVISLSQPAYAKGLYTVSDVPSADTVEVNTLPPGLYETVRYTVVQGAKAIRNLPGVVRISDVAVAGAIPHNWNPYSEGVSTAEEFTLATTGIVQELAQMSGRLYVYTNNSIYVLSKTGNDSIPYISDIASATHGALCMGAVQEFKGIHIVVGSNDIYQFSGNSASIKSIGYSRVRDYFFNNISAQYASNMFMLMNPAQDEVWINYPTVNSSQGRINEQLIFNYNENVWTRRVISEAMCGVMANTKYIDDVGALSAEVDPSIYRPVFGINQIIYACDFDNKFTNLIGTNYESYIERVEAPMTPEFDVEGLHSVAVWASKTTTSTVKLRLRFRPTDYPSQVMPSALTSNAGGSQINNTFIIGEDYKTDLRVSGRFLNYRITDEDEEGNYWSISGLQLDLKKGGRR